LRNAVEVIAVQTALLTERTFLVNDDGLVNLRIHCHYSHLHPHFRWCFRLWN